MWLLKHWDVVSMTVCLLAYAGTAAARFWKGDNPMALVFAAYAVSNLGLIWHFWKS